MAKVKVKTHSGAKKRFKRHRLTQKDTKRKRIARGAGICDCTNAPTIKKLVPYL